MTKTLITLAAIAAIVAGLGPQAWASHSSGTTIAELINLIGGDLFKIPDLLFSLGYNVGGTAADQIIDKIPCTLMPTQDEDACRNVSEMIRSRGFEVEDHEVTTRDGYILSVQKIINPLVEPQDRHKLKAVIVQHGISSVSTEWIIFSNYARPAPWPPREGPQDNNGTQAGEDLSGGEREHPRHPRSLPLYLANKGYSVYLTNSRGNRYSQKHVSLSTADPQYWDFSWDEQIDFDLPATINFVREDSGQKKISYVGWSQGATTMFGLMSVYPEYADIIEPFIALSPVTYMYHTKTPLRALLPIVPFSQDLNMGFAYSDTFTHIMSRVCGASRPQVMACLTLANQLFGDDNEGIDIHRLPSLVNHVPSGSSFKNIVHYGQLIVSKKFARYSYGLNGNMKKYGTPLAPEFNLTNIRSKSIAIFSADNDYLAAPKDVELLVSQLPHKPIRWYNMTVFDPKWNHLAYLYHKKLGTTQNPLVTKILDEYNRQPTQPQASASVNQPGSMSSR